MCYIQISRLSTTRGGPQSLWYHSWSLWCRLLRLSWGLYCDSYNTILYDCIRTCLNQVWTRDRTYEGGLNRGFPREEIKRKGKGRDYTLYLWLFILILESKEVTTFSFICVIGRFESFRGSKRNNFSLSKENFFLLKIQYK